VTNDIDNIAQSLHRPLSQMLTSVLLLLGVAIMMFTDLTMLAVVALTDRAGVGLRHAHHRRTAPARVIAQWKNTGALNAQIEETFTGHAIVKSFGRQHEVEHRFRETNDELYEHRSCAVHVEPHAAATMFIGQCAVRDRGDRRRAAGDERSITVGDVQAFIQYSRTFSMPPHNWPP